LPLQLGFKIGFDVAQLIALLQYCEFILVYLIEGKLCCQGAYGYCWFKSFNYQEKPRVVIWWKVTQWAGTINHTTMVETERVWAGRPRKKVFVLMLVIPTKVYLSG
jgi:hypothetical protein